MGSVIDYEACPKCKGLMMTDTYYKSGEEYHFCYRCGYHLAWEMKRDDNGEIIFINQNGFEVPDMKETIYEGHGSYRIMPKEGAGQSGGFDEPITQEQIDEFEKIFNQDDVDQSTSYLIRFEDGNAEILFGNPPDDVLLSFDEFDKKMMEDSPEDIETTDIPTDELPL